jgi:hypothetical protein
VDKLDAAKKYMAMKLVPVKFTFEGGGDAPGIITH